MKITERSQQAVSKRYVDQFRAALADMINGVARAGQIYVQAITEEPEMAALFATEFASTIPSTAWASFEAVGRGWMHPKLLMGAGGRYAAKIKRLPYSTQEQIFEGKRFDLLTASGEILKVDIRECQPEQVEQLVDATRIRSLAEQKAWIEAQRAAAPKDEVEVMPYIITDGKVTFRRGVSLTRQEIKRLLQEM
jgi:hypothetical protein